MRIGYSFSYILILLFLPVIASRAEATRLDPGLHRARVLHGQASGKHPAPPVERYDSDLVVGDPDSNEIRTITGSHVLNGNIFVLNNGTLILDSADFTLRGNIYLFDNGTMQVHKGELKLPQQFGYQYNAFVLDNSRMLFDSCRVDPNSTSWGIQAHGSSELHVTGAELAGGLVTVALGGSSVLRYSDADFASELLAADSCRIEVHRSRAILMMLGFPNGSAASLELPAADTTIRYWRMRPDSAGVSGIGYTITLDSVSGLTWGTLQLPGSDITLRNSNIQVVGLMMLGSDSLNISGLLNNLHHTDYRLTLPDRRFRLQNSYLKSWNLYVADSARFVIESSIFGELLAFGEHPDVLISGSICDGSGGYIGAGDNARVAILLSTINTQTTARDRSMLIAVGSTFRFGGIDANENALMAFLISSLEFAPNARDTSIIYLGDIAVPPGSAVGTDVAITGTADLLPGPANPVRFAGYRLFYAPAASPGERHPVGPLKTEPVSRDTLDIWDTRGFEPGRYILRLALYNSSGDSIEPTREVVLGFAALKEDTPASASPPLLSRPEPNPSSGPVKMTFSPMKPTRFQLAVYDLGGRLIRRLADDHLPAGNHTFTWDGRDNTGRRVSAGSYLIRLTTPDLQAQNRLVLLR